MNVLDPERVETPTASSSARPALKSLIEFSLMKEMSHVSVTTGCTVLTKYGRGDLTYSVNSVMVRNGVRPE